MRPQARRWGVVLVLIGIGAGASVVVPLILRRVVDRVADGASAGEVRGLGAVAVVVAAVGLAATIASIAAATATAWRTTNELRVQMTRHVLGLDHEFHRSHTPGELISRVDGDVTSVSDFLSTVLVKALASVLMLAGAIVSLAVIQWPLAVAMSLFTAVATAAVVASRHRSIDEAAEEMHANAALYGGIEERLNAAEDLRANGALAHAMGGFVDESRAVLTTTVARGRAFLGMWWVMQGSVAAGAVTSVAASAWLVQNGSMTVGTALLLFQYVVLVSRPMEQIVHEIEIVQKANAALERVVALLAERPTILDEGTTSPDPGPLSVTAAGVTFDYGDDQPVLHDIDLAIDAGHSVGIVGRTGSGKTTLSRLVLRLVEATEGELRLGGVPVAEIPLGELRRRVCLIPQEVELFGATVRDNVTLFDDAHGDDAVTEALAAVGLDRLAAGDLDRELGPGGAGLSAGEGQLLSLARAWLRRPDLIVLDEATARVDPETEERIDRAVRQLTQGRTTLIIAHRLSTLRRVDDIAVFDHGRLVEFGARDALAGDATSRYARLVRAAGGAAPDAEVLT